MPYPRRAKNYNSKEVPQRVLEKLRAYRIAHDLTWQELSDRFRENGIPVSLSALYTILQNAYPTANERTVHKLEDFADRFCKAPEAASGAKR